MSRLSRIAAANIPATLRSRVSLVILLTNLIVLVGAAALLQCQTAYYERTASEERVVDLLAQLDSYLALHLESLDIQCLNYVEWDEFRGLSGGPEPPNPEWMASELAGWLPNVMDIDLAAWVAADGTVLWSCGSQADVSRLVALGPTALEQPIKDRVAMEEGPALVVVRPTTGFPHEAPRGFLALGRRMDDAMMADFARISAASAVSVGPEATHRTDNRLATKTRAGYSDVRVSSRGGALLSDAILLDRDGRPAGCVRVEGPLPVASATLPLRLGTLFGTIMFSALAGLLVGGMVVRFVQQPVDSLVDYVGRVGERAVQGAPYEPMAIGPLTPIELRTALEVVDGLTRHLSVRQAQLREALEEVRQVEERMRIAVDESSEAKILVVDGVVRLANPAAATQFGSPPEGLLGRTVEEAFSRMEFTDENERVVGFGELVSKAGSEGLVVSAPAPSGHSRWLEIRVVRHPERGEFLVTSRDITDLRRYLEVREEMLSLVSHDLKSPLTVISGYVDILETRSGDEIVSKAISGLRGAIARMMELLEDVMSTARIDEMFAPQTMSPIDLACLAGSVVSAMTVGVPQTLDLKTASRPEVRGEQRRLRQVMVNLIVNASRFSPSDSIISIEVGSGETSAFFAVEDSGPGIPPDERERIFERFVRLDRGQDAPAGGGLGLYIVRAIVTAHGGTVRVEDAVGHTGARFVVELPLQEAVAPGETAGA